jgi:hypothetical protein
MSKTHCFSRFKIYEIVVTSKNQCRNITLAKRKQNLHVHDTGHGTMNTKMATEGFRKYFSVFPSSEMSFRMTVYKAREGGLEAEKSK